MNFVCLKGIQSSAEINQVSEGKIGESVERNLKKRGPRAERNGKNCERPHRTMQLFANWSIVVSTFIGLAWTTNDVEWIQIISPKPADDNEEKCELFRRTTN